jgi:cytochrome c
MPPSNRALVIAAALALAACGDNHRARDLPEAGTGSGSDPNGQPPDDYIFSRLNGQPGKPRVLVYTFMNYWQHYSSISCMSAIWDMARTRGFTVLTTNHPLGINSANLAQVDVVAFCVTSGRGLSPQGQADLEAWIRAGGGTVGFHAASYTEPFWKFYVDHIGTLFATHADGLWPATLRTATTHPITAGLGDFQLTDEWYVFVQRPETIPGAQMVIALDEGTLPAGYPAALKQGYHAIAWTSERDGGRMFYSAFGHVPENFSDPNVLEIVGRSIEWAAHQR